MESCTLFTRRGLQSRQRRGGRRLAKLSVSALMFDYILTSDQFVAAGNICWLFGDMLKLATGTRPIRLFSNHHHQCAEFLTMLIAIGITVISGA